MRVSLRPRALLTLPLVLFLLAGCGGGDNTDTAAAKSTPAPAKAQTSGLDDGPRAIDTMTPNPGLAEWGETLFQEKICITCHAIGETKQGPDLSGVTTRRTEAWMKRMIMDPEFMIANDPIARELMAKYMIKMANQQVAETQANALMQYLLAKDLESEGE